MMLPSNSFKFMCLLAGLANAAHQDKWSGSLYAKGSLVKVWVEDPLTDEGQWYMGKVTDRIGGEYDVKYGPKKYDRDWFYPSVCEGTCLLETQVQGGKRLPAHTTRQACEAAGCTWIDCGSEADVEFIHSDQNVQKMEKECGKCRGQGEIIIPAGWFSDQQTKPCADCRGVGRIGHVYKNTYRCNCGEGHWVPNVTKIQPAPKKFFVGARVVYFRKNSKRGASKNYEGVVTKVYNGETGSYAYRVDLVTSDGNTKSKKLVLSELRKKGSELLWAIGPLRRQFFVGARVVHTRKRNGKTKTYQGVVKEVCTGKDSGSYKVDLMCANGKTAERTLPSSRLAWASDDLLKVDPTHLRRLMGSQ